MRRGKAPGICNISAELLIDSRHSTILCLHRVICKYRDRKRFQKTGNKHSLSHCIRRRATVNTVITQPPQCPRALFTRLILNRINSRINNVLPHNQMDSVQVGDVVPTSFWWNRLSRRSWSLMRIYTYASWTSHRVMTPYGGKSVENDATIWSTWENCSLAKGPLFHNISQSESRWWTVWYSSYIYCNVNVNVNVNLYSA